jgi:hypothetical protein
MNQRVRLAATLAFCFFGLVLITGAAGQSSDANAGSVWDGVFTSEQAQRGSLKFIENCSACHGPELQGTAEAKSLKGDRFWTDWKETTVDYLFERISKSMPFSEDGSLAGTLPEETYIDIVAHILNTNGLPAGKRELSPASARGVAIIRKEGPGELPASTLAKIVGCLTRAGNGPWRLVRATTPVRVRGGISRPNTPEANTLEFELKFVLTPLDKFIGHRLEVTGLLIGEGGKEGVNFSSANSLSATCQ